MGKNTKNPCLEKATHQGSHVSFGVVLRFANFQPFDSFMYQLKSLFLELIPTFPHPFLLKVALMSSKKHPQISPVDRVILGNLFEGVYASGMSHCLFGKRTSYFSANLYERLYGN